MYSKHNFVFGMKGIGRDVLFIYNWMFYLDLWTGSVKYINGVFNMFIYEMLLMVYVHCWGDFFSNIEHGLLKI